MKFTITTFMLLVFGMIIYTAGSAEHETKDEASKDVPSMSVAEMKDHMKMMNQMMVKHLNEGDDYDKRFLDSMILHHQGGVLMAEDALKKATHEEIKQMSQKMIDQQKKEIQQMKDLKKQWYKDQPKDSETDDQ